jgi:hypothetical protein
MSAISSPMVRPAAAGRLTFPAASAATFVALVGALMALTPATDPDLGWHLRSGYLILQQHAIPRTDPYSFTAAGASWVEHEWLWQVTMALVHHATGDIGMLLANAILVGAALALVYLRLRIRGLSALFASAGAAAALTQLILPAGVRPGMVTALLSAMYLFAFEAYERSKRWPWLAALIPCQAIWANSHGSYVLGLALCGIYAVAARVDQRSWRAALPWAGLGGALAAASLANPYGWRLIEFTLFAARLPVNRQIAEWQAPDFTSMSAAPLLALLVLSAAAAAALRVRRTPWPRAKAQVGLLLFATAGSLWSNQMQLLYAIAAAPTVIEMLCHVLRPEPRDQISWPSGACLLLAGAAVVLAGPAQRLSPANYERALAATFPVNAVDYIERNQLQGPMWNEYDWGGYLIGALPHVPVFVDGRTEVYGQEFLERYFAVQRGLAPPNELFQAYGVRLALTRREGPVTDELHQDAEWQEVYRDDMAAVFVRQA